MSKKKTGRRPNISQEVLERARAEMRGEIASSTSSSSEGSGAVTAKPKTAPRMVMGAVGTRHIPTADELKQEYRHIVGDLRKVITLASVLFLFVILMAVFVMPALG
ncbi:MAG: hypothetical protein OHK0023_02880 [Anaerolineae bacterium]